MIYTSKTWIFQHYVKIWIVFNYYLNIVIVDMFYSDALKEQKPLCTVFLIFACDDYGHICKGSKHSVVKKVISMCSNYVSKQVWQCLCKK